MEENKYIIKKNEAISYWKVDNIFFVASNFKKFMDLDIFLETNFSFFYN